VLKVKLGHKAFPENVVFQVQLVNLVKKVSQAEQRKHVWQN